MSLPTSFKLNTGAVVPSIGLGTWQSNPGEVAKAVEYAIKEVGYRHIDCAHCYGNEAEVGQGIVAAGVPRSELFITGKLWSTYHTRVEEQLDITLKDLQTDYVDLFLIHWPVALNPDGNHRMFPRLADGTRDRTPERTIEQTWADMEKVLKLGKTKAIGVSNWSIPNLERILASGTVVPAVNQVELHPYNPQHDVVKFCQDRGILVEAYSPLGSTNSPLLADEDVVAVAKKHNAGVPNVLVSYQISRGIVGLPKSVTPSRIADNFKLVPLDEEDVKTLDAIEGKGKHRRFVSPDWNVTLGFADGW